MRGKKAWVGEPEFPGSECSPAHGSTGGALSSTSGGVSKPRRPGGGPRSCRPDPWSSSRDGRCGRGSSSRSGSALAEKDEKQPEPEAKRGGEAGGRPSRPNPEKPRGPARTSSSRPHSATASVVHGHQGPRPEGGARSGHALRRRLGVDGEVEPEPRRRVRVRRQLRHGRTTGGTRRVAPRYMAYAFVIGEFAHVRVGGGCATSRFEGRYLPGPRSGSRPGGTCPCCRGRRAGSVLLHGRHRAGVGLPRRRAARRSIAGRSALWASGSSSDQRARAVFAVRSRDDAAAGRGRVAAHVVARGDRRPRSRVMVLLRSRDVERRAVEDRLAERREVVAGGGRDLREQRGLGHARQRVHLEHVLVLALGHEQVDAARAVAAERLAARSARFSTPRVRVGARRAGMRYSVMPGVYFAL